MNRAFALVLLLASISVADAAAENKSAGAIDLSRYAGTWHEIARLPNYFQRKCARDVTATYTLAGDHVRVVNRCVLADGDTIVAAGRARVVDAPVNRRLKVGFVHIFGWWPFEGDYWILDIEPEYRWVIVGGPNRKYAWVLARAPTLDAATRSYIDGRLRAYGYDPALFVRDQQQEGAR